MTIDTSTQTITDVLSKLGIDPSANQLPDSGGRGWAVPTDKSILFIHVGDADGVAFIRVTCPILFMPSQDLLPFYRKMLDLNSQLANASLAMDRDIVCVVNQQALDGLTHAAVEGLILELQKSTSGLADLLIQEFHSARFWKPM